MSRFCRKELTELGFFLSVDTQKWAMTEVEKEKHSKTRLKERRSTKNPLIHWYKLVAALQLGGFDKILEEYEAIESRKMMVSKAHGIHQSEELM